LIDGAERRTAASDSAPTARYSSQKLSAEEDAQLKASLRVLTKQVGAPRLSERSENPLRRGNRPT